MAKLDNRSYRYKKPTMEFYCPLCRTQRAFISKPRLSGFNYAQIILLTVSLTAAMFPLMGLKGSFCFFPIWLSFEFVVRARFRKEIPCPHCGFDASWYKRDVKVARKLVKEFWNEGQKEVESAGEAPAAGPDEPAPYIPEVSEDLINENPYLS